MKQEGNTMFKAKTFDAAIAKYSQALACLSEIRDEDEADSDDEDEFEFDGHPDVKALQISLYLNLSMTYMKQNRCVALTASWRLEQRHLPSGGEEGGGGDSNPTPLSLPVCLHAPRRSFVRSVGLSAWLSEKSKWPVHFQNLAR
jgi:hypothetical protein